MSSVGAHRQAGTRSHIFPPEPRRASHDYNRDQGRHGEPRHAVWTGGLATPIGVRAARGCQKGDPMKKSLSVLAAVLLLATVGAPAFAQQAPKGTEGPDIRKQEPKGTEGPDIRKQAKEKTASHETQKPRGTKVPDIRKGAKKKPASAQKPKGIEGPDVRKVEPKGTEGPDVR